MADYALLIGWDRPIAGRESYAVELLTSMQNYLGKQVTTGNIESFEAVLPEVHGGELNGFILVRGDHQKLHTLRVSNEFNDLVLKANTCVTRLGVINCYLGRKMMDQVSIFLKSVPKG